MMFSGKFLGTLLILTVFTGLAAQVSAQEFKLCTVDFQQALNNVPEGKQAKDNLKAQFEAKQAQLNGQQEGLKALQEELKNKGAAWSPEVRQKKEEEYREKFLALQKTLTDARNKLMTDEAALTEKIVGKLKAVVASLGKQKDCTAVFENSSDVVLYAKNPIDITTEVISNYK